MQTLFRFSMLGDALGVNGVDWEEEEEKKKPLWARKNNSCTPQTP